MKPDYEKRETVYSNAHQKVYRVRASIEDSTRELYITDYGPRAAIVVEGPQGILITRQYRYLIGALSWEIPGGKADEGEQLRDAAVRECLEETGVLCHALQPLIMFHPGLDTLYNPTHVFYTSNFEAVTDQSRHDAEVAETVWIALAKCLAMISQGEIVDSLSIIALLSYSRHIDAR